MAPEAEAAKRVERPSAQHRRAVGRILTQPARHGRAPHDERRQDDIALGERSGVAVRQAEVDAREEPGGAVHVAGEVALEPGGVVAVGVTGQRLVVHRGHDRDAVGQLVHGQHARRRAVGV
jgi:hypothetical protein